MMFFHGDAQQIKPMLDKQNIKYAISIGRRAPMHRMHVACLQEIQAAGLQPVLVLGSVNHKLGHFYDPLRNPLTLNQQKEQLKQAMPDLYDEKYIISLADQEDPQWLDEFFNIIAQKHYLDSAIIHYRTKIFDKSADSAQVQPLNTYMQAFIARGLPVWESFNHNPEDDNIHASDLRKLDLVNLTNEHRKVLAAADYIIDIAKMARANNLDKHLLTAAAIPITTLDLSLMRLRQEIGIPTAQIIMKAAQTGFVTIDSITASAYQILHQLQGHRKSEG